MEIGVRVTAQAIGSDERHINTGYLTVMAVDPETDKPVNTPRVLPENPAQEKQFELALGRRRLRMERKKLTGKPKAAGLAWTWSDEMSSEISVANVYGLLRVASDFSLPWDRRELGGMGEKFEMRMEVNRNTFGSGVVTIRVWGRVSCDLKKMFKAVLDVEKRAEWDLAIAGTAVRQKIDANNDILWTAYPSFSEPGTTTDYSLLRTWKQDEDRYIIASRSVAHPAVPVSADGKYTRGEVNPSGFILSPWTMDDGMGDWRGDENAAQTSFDYLVQLDEATQKMLGGNIGTAEANGEQAEAKYVQVLVGSLVKLCTMLSEE